jgi:hypothetical protein
MQQQEIDLLTVPLPPEKQSDGKVGQDSSSLSSAAEHITSEIKFHALSSSTEDSTANLGTPPPSTSIDHRSLQISTLPTRVSPLHSRRISPPILANLSLHHNKILCETKRLGDSDEKSPEYAGQVRRCQEICCDGGGRGDGDTGGGGSQKYQYECQ